MSNRPFAFSTQTPPAGTAGSSLLGRLGHELGHLYSDALQVPLPPGLQCIVDRLGLAPSPSDTEGSLGHHESGRDD